MSYPKFDPNVDYTNSAIKTHTIERVKLHFGKFLPIHTPLDVSIREYCDNLAHGFACEVQFKLFGAENILEHTEHKRETVDFEIPETWWDHFKQDCFPKWLLKYFPFKTKKLNMEVHSTWNKYVTRVCPHTASKEERVHLNWIVSGVVQTEDIHMPKKCSRCGHIMSLHDEFSSFSVYHCLNCNNYEKVDK